MKQQLFENKGGNRFILTESITESNKVDLLKEGLKKVFGNAEGGRISYERIKTVGMGYISNVNAAYETSIKEARKLAEGFGYKDDHVNNIFIKESQWDVRDFDTPEQIESREENREIQIGSSIVKLCQEALNNDTDDMNKFIFNLNKIEKLANELIKMHQK